MAKQPNALSRLLFENKNLTLAYLDHATDPPKLIVYHAAGFACQALDIPPELQSYEMELIPSPRIIDLRAWGYSPFSSSPHQRCQNFPIDCGCQIQPKAMPWVGTAGCVVKWTSEDGKTHWGILSNYHVIVPQIPALPYPVHQPTDRYGEIAQLFDYYKPNRAVSNKMDAAIADAKIAGFHSVSGRILGIGQPNQKWSDSTVSLQVVKSGRTTGVTEGVCIATGVSVRVTYPHGSALFEDQDLFKGTQKPFSQPGDSGSLILAAKSLSPVALLFAGGGDLTVASPIRFVVDRFGLSFAL